MQGGYLYFLIILNQIITILDFILHRLPLALFKIVIGLLITYETVC